MARLTGVKIRVIRYLLGPTSTYALYIQSRLKKKKKKGAKKKEKKEKRNRQSKNNQTKQRMLADQSARTILDIL